MKNRKKQSLKFIIVLAIMFIGIGYAYLTTTLSINGTTDIDSNSWNIYWDNVQVVDGSVTGEQVTQAPTIDATGTTVSFHVRLKEPGEFYEFSIDAVNAGTIDAMIDNISYSVNNMSIDSLPDYLVFYTFYGTGDIDIEEKQLLKAGTSERYTIGVYYKEDISASSLPSENQSFNLNFGVEYVQADNTAKIVRGVVYTGHNQENTIWKTISPGYFNTYQEALETTSINAFIKNIIKNNYVDDMELGIFINDDEIIYLRGGGAGYSASQGQYTYSSIYYEENKNKLFEKYGAICEERTNDMGSYTAIYTVCYDGTYTIEASKNGMVGYRSSASNYECYIKDEKSYCGTQTIG